MSEFREWFKDWAKWFSIGMLIGVIVMLLGWFAIMWIAPKL